MRENAISAAAINTVRATVDGRRSLYLPALPPVKIIKDMYEDFQKRQFTGTRKKKSGSGCAAFGARVHTAFAPSGLARTKHLPFVPGFPKPLIAFTPQPICNHFPL